MLLCVITVHLVFCVKRVGNRLFTLYATILPGPHRKKLTTKGASDLGNSELSLHHPGSRPMAHPRVPLLLGFHQ